MSGTLARSRDSASRRRIQRTLVTVLAPMLAALMSCVDDQRTWAFLSDEQNPVALTREEIDTAKSSLHLVLYKFDEKSLETAIIDALKRGVEILIVADAKEASRSSNRIAALERQGADVRLWKEGKLHVKLAIIDETRAITGSFNWTISAESRNTELVVVSRHPALVGRLNALFGQLWQEAQPVSGEPHS